MFYLRCDGPDCANEVGPWGQPALDDDELWPAGWVTAGFTEYGVERPEESEEQESMINAVLSMMGDHVKHLVAQGIAASSDEGRLRLRSAFCSWTCASAWVHERTPIAQAEALLNNG